MSPVVFAVGDVGLSWLCRKPMFPLSSRNGASASDGVHQR
jgi:hypothetical protein